MKISKNGDTPSQQSSTNGAKRVTGKSVRNITQLTVIANDKEKIRLVFDLTESTPDTWTRLGFDEQLIEGDYLIPSVIGKVTHFNANGKEIVRDDLPKESVPVTFWATWKDWHGYSHSGYKTRDYDKYPRQYIPAPSAELQILEIESKYYVGTEVINLSKHNSERTLHLMNLMLECFGEFQIIDADTEKVLGTKVRTLQWEIFPKGKYPWSKTKEIVKNYTNRLEPLEKELIEARIKEISGFDPDFAASGNGGFSGYFAFGFEEKGIFVLESVHLDNATYIFGDDWEALSKLTKNEIINGSTDFKRIIHNESWIWRIHRLLK